MYSFQYHSLNDAKKMTEAQLRAEIEALIEEEPLPYERQLWLDVCQYMLALKYEVIYPNSLYQTRK